MATLRLGDPAPGFTADTTDGLIDLLDWKRSSWTVFFSHPPDDTPACTSELGASARLRHEVERRNTRVIALSVDPIGDHRRWAPDIGDVGGTDLNFPIVADEDDGVATACDMVHRAGGDTSAVRSVFIFDPDDKIRLILSNPKSVRRDVAEILHVDDDLPGGQADGIAEDLDEPATVQPSTEEEVHQTLARLATREPDDPRAGGFRRSRRDDPVGGRTLPLLWGVRL